MKLKYFLLIIISVLITNCSSNQGMKPEDFKKPKTKTDN